MIEGDQIIRKLTGYESSLEVDHKEKGKYINPRAFLIDSKIDLFKNEKIVKDSIKTWVELHPLLQSKIKKQKLNIHGEMLTRKFFAYADKSKLDSLENVLFLKYEDHTRAEATDDEYWKLLFGNELNQPLDTENGPLWRIMFLELSNCQDSFKYCVVFNVMHSLTDGSNAYNIMKELLKIIEYTEAHKCFTIDANRKKLADLERQYPNDPRSGEKSKDFYYEPPLEIPTSIIVPEFMKPKMDNKANTMCLQDLPGIFRNANGTIFASVNKLIENRSNRCAQLKFINIETEKFEMLLKKVKSHEAKLTGCIETIINLALKRAFQNGFGFENFYSNLTYGISINTRLHLNPPLDNCVMGIWVNCILNHINDCETPFEQQSFWETTFWQLVKNNTEKLHEYIKEKPFFDPILLQNAENMYYKMEKGYKVKDLDVFYGLTNIGAVSSCAEDSLNKIKIRQYYSAISYLATDFFAAVFHSISSIDNMLCWCISYNGNILSEETMSKWIENIYQIIDLIISK